ncbi:MAG: glycerol-3-phosphate ABC transporter ATP-binding protein [Candidatus Neomarinimicrobiota bacterium]|nr:MAG: glycerol-3-phosphate ABC transporter ATP-binding protein [Candidatus Neomarinimicrobiota bacterium]
MAEIILKNLTKEFEKGKPVVNNINLHIKDGEFVVIVGPSGCGKSTTLRLIAGLEEATSGEIYIGGRIVNDVPPKDRDVAMVFQNYALYPHMTVYDNMAFGLKLRKYKKEEIKKRVIEAAEVLEIAHLMDKRPAQLSGGQRQRVALGRAIVRKPSVFLFDEPLSNIDAKLRVQMRSEIKRLHRKLGTTMIYVTHDQVEAMTMGDRIVVMKDGIIHQIDDPVNLYNRPSNIFVAGFIGSPSMNLLRGRVVNSTGINVSIGNHVIKLPDDHRDFLRDYVGKEVILGIRPEDVSLKPYGEKWCELSLPVELVEPMGSETILYFSLGKTQIVSRSVEFYVGSIGEIAKVYLNLDRAHYFDPGTGKAIRR